MHMYIEYVCMYKYVHVNYIHVVYIERVTFTCGWQNVYVAREPISGEPEIG